MSIIYMGQSFDTITEACIHCAYEWATAGGANSLWLALEALRVPYMVVDRMTRDGWSWPDGADADDKKTGIIRARDQIILERATEGAA